MYRLSLGSVPRTGNRDEDCEAFFIDRVAQGPLAPYCRRIELAGGCGPCSGGTSADRRDGYTRFALLVPPSLDRLYTGRFATKYVNSYSLPAFLSWMAINGYATVDMRHVEVVTSQFWIQFQGADGDVETPLAPDTPDQVYQLRFSSTHYPGDMNRQAEVMVVDRVPAGPLRALVKPHAPWSQRGCGPCAGNTSQHHPDRFAVRLPAAVERMYSGMEHSDLSNQNVLPGLLSWLDANDYVIMDLKDVFSPAQGSLWIRYEGTDLQGMRSRAGPRPRNPGLREPTAPQSDLPAPTRSVYAGATRSIKGGAASHRRRPRACNPVRSARPSEATDDGVDCPSPPAGAYPEAPATPSPSPSSLARARSQLPGQPQVRARPGGRVRGRR